MYTATDRTPFTYLITHKVTGKRYYGARYARRCAPADLGTTYFSSCKEIKQLLKLEGKDAFLWEVRLVCSSIEQVLIYETKVLQRIGAAKRDDWFNKSNGYGKYQGIARTGENNVSKRFDVRAKISKSKRGKKLGAWSETHRKNLTATMQHRTPWTAEQKAKQSKLIKEKSKNRIGKPSGMLGRTHSIEAKKKMSASHATQIPWNKGKKGYKRAPCSAETKKKIAAANKGKPAWNKKLVT